MIRQNHLAGKPKNGYNTRGDTGGIAQRGGGLVLKDGIDQKAFIYYHRQQDGIFPHFPGTAAEVLDGNYCYMRVYLFKSKEVDSHVEHISWEVYADNAPVELGSVPIYELLF